MVKREDLRTLQKHCSSPVGRQAIDLAERIMTERDNVIALAKELLMRPRAVRDEKEALAIIFSRLHGGSSVVTAKMKSPYNMENISND